jgi:hypothetical protein
MDFLVYGGYGNGNTPLELAVSPAVGTPVITSAKCDQDYGGVRVLGTCEHDTYMYFDDETVIRYCGQGGTFDAWRSFQTGTAPPRLRAFEAGRPSSPWVSIPLDRNTLCPPK